MVLQTRRIVDAEVDHFVMLPENRNRDYKFIAGKIVEVASSNESSRTTIKSLTRTRVHVADNSLERS